jgi:hygromycin-B 7''-O-kinase
VTIDTFDIDIATADRVVALADSGFRTETITRLAGGANSAVFDVSSNQGQSMVVKVYSDLLHWKMEKEVFVYERMRRHGFDALVPAILAADDSKSLLCQSFLVMTKLPGSTVASLDADFGERELVAINRQIGALLAGLHEISFDEFGYVGTHGVVDGYAANRDYMRAQFDKRLRELDEHGGDPELRGRIEHYVARREELLVTPRAAFCHNDCHYGNVLVVPAGDGWRISGLVDFENVLSGDPLLDLAKTHGYAREHRTEATLAALAEGHGDMPPNWREALDLYVLYHALELWVWFAYLDVREPLDGLSRDMAELVFA